MLSKTDAAQPGLVEHDAAEIASDERAPLERRLAPAALAKLAALERAAEQLFAAQIDFREVEPRERFVCEVIAAREPLALAVAYIAHAALVPSTPKACSLRSRPTPVSALLLRHESLRELVPGTMRTRGLSTAFDAEDAHTMLRAWTILAASTLT